LVTLPRRIGTLLPLAALTAAGCGGERGAGARTTSDEAVAALHEAAASAPAELARGRALYEESCSVCHGAVAEGTEQGPPLAHEIYEPSHHADAAFVLAVKIGVRAHHWRFGDMEPLPHVTEDMVAEITGYVRWLQRRVGIE
jgi:cytochrome c